MDQGHCEQALKMIDCALAKGVGTIISRARPRWKLRLRQGNREQDPGRGEIPTRSKVRRAGFSVPYFPVKRKEEALPEERLSNVKQEAQALMDCAWMAVRAIV